MKKPVFSLPLCKQIQAFFSIVCVCFIFVSPSSQAENISSKHIEIIAASCAACHGTNGRGVDDVKPLAGLPANDIEQNLVAFKNGKRPSKVMHHHAKGLTDQEILEVANYFSQQTPSQSQLPPKPNSP